jgi:hypothetical protein
VTSILIIPLLDTGTAAMRRPTFLLAAALGLALSGAAQAQSSVTSPGQGSVGNSGTSLGGSAAGSPATTGTAPGAGAVRNPNAAPLPSAGRGIAPGTGAPSAPPSGAAHR